MSKIIGIIGVALMATVAQPAISAASRGVENNAQFGVRTAPVQIVSDGTATTGPRAVDQSFLRWVRYANGIFFKLTTRLPR